MNSYLAVFSSITVATRVKRYFEGMGIIIHLMRTPSRLTDASCSYCVRFSENNIDIMRSLIASSGIKCKGIYKAAEKGMYKEVPV